MELIYINITKSLLLCEEEEGLPREVDCDQGAASSVVCSAPCFSASPLGVPVASYRNVWKTLSQLPLPPPRLGNVAVIKLH